MHECGEGFFIEGKLIIGSSENANMRYGADVFLPSKSIWLEIRGEEYLIVPEADFARVKGEVEKGIEVIKMEELRNELPNRMDTSPATIATLFLKKKEVYDVHVPPELETDQYKEILNNGIKPVVKENFFPERMIKKRAEVNSIEDAGRSAGKAMKRVISLIKESSENRAGYLNLNREKLTSDFLKKEAKKVLVEENCSCNDIIVSHGRQTALPHERGSGTLRKEEPIIIDVFPESLESGYCFDVSRTVVKGEPSEKIQEMRTAVKQAQERVFSILKDGVEISQLYKECRKELRKHGFKEEEDQGFIHSVGHGVGLEVHEDPSLKKGSEGVLESGMVLAIEPALYYEDIGGVRLEDTVLITKKGYRNLTKLDKKFVL